MKTTAQAAATPKTPPIYQVALIIRPDSPQLSSACLEIIATFERAGIGVYVEEMSARALQIPRKFVRSIDEILHSAQALVSLGGDGTLISAVHKSIGSGLPVFGINMGRLGFLTAIKPEELSDFIPLLLQGDYILDSHRLLEGMICSKNMANDDFASLDFAQKPATPFYALNEIFITKKDISGMLRIHAKVEGKPFNTYRVDGLIIATPTGSSAYNISAGGSVVHPTCQVMLLTPVCAHSLTQRPMVLSDDMVLAFEVGEDAMIMLDGQDRIEFGIDDMLVVRKSLNVQLIQHPKRDYFAVLEEKFSWGGCK